MDLLDRLALAGRKYVARRSAITGKTDLSLDEVLRAFNGKTILEMDVRASGKTPAHFEHALGRPVSLVDGVAELGSNGSGTYEVLETPPSGDYSKARVMSKTTGGELQLLVGKRTIDHHPFEDALLDTLRNRTSNA